MIQNGRYTLVYSNGEYRTLSINNNEGEDSGSFKGKSILSRKSGSRYEGIAFLSADNRVMLWKRFRNEFDPKRLEALQNAINRIARNPMEAGMAYAMKEGRCCRCGRELTVPASIHAGMGPDCAEKYAWEKIDQIAAREAVAAVRTPGSVYADPNAAPVQTGFHFEATSYETRTTPVKDDKAVISRMVSFLKAMETEKFYDPFGIGEQLTEGAAVQFWTKRFTANPIEDDRFWGDEAGRQEVIDEREAEMSSLRAEEQMNERRYQAVYGNEPVESF
jgi:hypothetical protein